MLFLIIIFVLVFGMILLRNHLKVSRHKKETIIINIINQAFDRHNVEIHEYDSVEFRNHDIIRHTIISNSPDILNSALILPQTKYKVYFPKPGFYVLSSSLYGKSMKPVYIQVRKIE